MIKALSLKQPYAWFIRRGFKTIETRTWKTEYRGPLLICASKTIDKELDDDFMKCFATGFVYLEDRKLGYAVAIVELYDCIPMTKEHEKEAMCPLYPRAWAWLLKDLKRIEAFKVKGQLRLFDVELPKGMVYAK